MYKTLFLSLLTATLLVACSSDDAEEPQLLEEPRLLTVEVMENTLIDTNGAPMQAPTRTAAAITTGTLTEFYMNYQKNAYTFTKTDGTWNTTYSWPTLNPEDGLDFYAYNYKDEEEGDRFYWNNDNDPYISYVMSDNDAFNQTDLLVAKHEDISYNDAGGKVSLTFDHACAAVKFNISKTSGVGNKQIDVTSVQLSGVKNKGEYHYNNTPNTPHWEYLSGSASYKLTTAKNITLTTEKTALPCGYLFLIPQTKVGLTLTVEYTVEGVEGTQSHDFELTGTWEAGIEYVVNINMGTSIIK